GALRDECGERRQRRLTAWEESVGPETRPAIDLSPPGHGAPNEIGIEPDDRIAPAHRAALDRFQQKAQRTGTRNLEESRYRRFEVGHQRGPDDLGLAARIAFGNRRPLRLDLHGLLHRSVKAVAGTTADHLVQRALIDGHPGLAFELGDIFGEKGFGEATVE